MGNIFGKVVYRIHLGQKPRRYRRRFDQSEMKLPHSDQAIVDREKITHYLLSASHPDGAPKAAFFLSFGFHPQNWETLADAFRKHCNVNPVSKRVDSQYGGRYSVDGKLETPDGRNPLMRSIWIIEADSKTPRLVTAYPL